MHERLKRGAANGRKTLLMQLNKNFRLMYHNFKHYMNSISEDGLGNG